MTRSVNGTIYTLTSGDYFAQIASVGAAVMALEYQGRALVRPFDAQTVRPVFSGALLAPWPNRVVDGRYEFNGHEHQLALSEPSRSHALHGLVVNTEFAATARRTDYVHLTALIPAQDGYPFALRLEVEFQLRADGLHTTVRAVNLGQDPAPVGFGSHSYLTAPGGLVDDWMLTLPAAAVQLTEGERLLPGRVLPVQQADGGTLDFGQARRIGSTFIDHAYTQLTPGADGTYRAEVRDAAGVGSFIAWDKRCPWVQVHTADRAEPELNRTGLAIEPMSCPPDAFNSGTDLITLPAGQRTEAWWLIGALTGD